MEDSYLIHIKNIITFAASV